MSRSSFMDLKLAVYNHDMTPILTGQTPTAATASAPVVLVQLWEHASKSKAVEFPRLSVEWLEANTLRTKHSFQYPDLVAQG